MRQEEAWERKQDRLPGGPAWDDDRAFEERLGYIERLTESINQKTKEIELIRKMLDKQLGL